MIRWVWSPGERSPSPGSWNEQHREAGQAPPRAAPGKISWPAHHQRNTAEKRRRPAALAHHLPQSIHARIFDLNSPVPASTCSHRTQLLRVEEPGPGTQHCLRKVPFCTLRLPSLFRRISHAFNCFRHLQTMIGGNIGRLSGQKAPSQNHKEFFFFLLHVPYLKRKEKAE